MFEFFSTGCQSLIAQSAAANDKASSVPFYNTEVFLAFAFIASIVIGILVARAISRAIQMSEYSGRIAIVLVTILVAGLMIWSKWPPKFGVDLRGGINMIGSLNLTPPEDDPDWKPVKASEIIPVLIKRINPSGTKEIYLRSVGDDMIELTIPSVDRQEADSIWSRLVETGKLEFRIVADAQNPRHQAAIALAREKAAAGSRKTVVDEVDDDGNRKVLATWVGLAREVSKGDVNDEDYVAPIKFTPQRGNLIRDKSTGRILEVADFQSSYGRYPDHPGRGLAEWFKEHGVHTPQILVIHPDEKMNVRGEHLSSITAGTDNKTGEPNVSFVMSSQGSRRLGRLTKMNQPEDGRYSLLGIVLDDQLQSAPRINEPIYRRGEISGHFTPEETKKLEAILKSGKLAVALNKEPLSKDFINSTLGSELKRKGLWAIGASLILVLVFMVFYYRFAGIVAAFGLILNLILVLALLMAIEYPLTMTGLAGLVLTIGMSVDANVLIFERIREELDRGAALRMAIRNGFDKATTTIVDANVTTLITALVLYIIGNEQIKGFSVTLILGILMSMFTAIFVARLIFEIAERKRWLKELKMARLLPKGQWGFVKKATLAGAISGLFILLGIGAMFVLGPRILNYDLRGGSTVRVVFNEPQDIDTIRKTLNDLDYAPYGEKIDFYVTSYAGSLSEDATDQGSNTNNLEFKIDSNLRAWEGAAKEKKFEQLDELIARVFKGKLKLFHAEILDGKPASDQEKKPKPKSDDSPNPGLGMQWQSIQPVVGSPNFTPSEQENSEPTIGAVPDQEDDHSENPDASSNDDSSSPSESGGSTSESSNDDSAEGTGEEAGAATSTGDDSPDANSGTPDTVNYITVSRTLKITPKISGKSLRTLILDAAKKLDLELGESDVVVDSPDVPEDADSPLNTFSEQWTVKLNVTQKSDADEVLAEWVSDFSQKPYFPTSSKVGGQIAHDTQWQALGAILASLIGIIAYIWIRFQNIAFGIAAVIALLHDVLFVLGAIALSHWLAGVFGFLGITEFKISLEIVAALLTVIGYSLNDTIVVFDRIREVRGKRSEITAEMIDTSISQTLSRTILTSLTTFIVVFILYWFGGDSIHGFAFALVVGVIVGTYSSIFIASPVLLWLMNTTGLDLGSVEEKNAN